jgi:MerR family transcriptional regulator, copper efflux regulator
MSDPPIDCTLDGSSVPDRLAGWRAILAHATSRTTTDDGARRVEFDGDIPVDELARLVVAEQQCCAFFSFAITVDHHGVALEVRAPDDATAVVDALFGQP